ncbi:acyl-CoA dehydrogenase/oxidase C-terminal, partial [Ochromonadaceae sp. CCMP2298]
MLTRVSRSKMVVRLGAQSLSSMTTTPPPVSKYYSRRNIEFNLLENPELIPPTCNVADMTAVLDAAESFVSRFSHMEKQFDTIEPEFDPISGSVALAPNTKPLLDAYVETGFTNMGAGGLELPYVLQCGVNSITMAPFTSGVLGHWVLTQCAANLLREHGSAELVSLYHSKMIGGEWTGTMALSETQAGSSLSFITTKATETSTAGTYSITGSKMWTTAADHTLYPNIVHMLLAKTDKGISLFLVPKFIVKQDGSLGERNSYEIGGVNHKMGSRGMSNCYWSLEGATGYLVGREGQGMQCMFTMMNEMRIHVGLGAAFCGVRGLQESLTYAVERRQGKQEGTLEQRPIVEYSDVKRMLLAQKAFSEGAMALCLFAAGLTESKDKQDKMLLEVLTPMVKAWPSEWCLEANKWAVQVLGGYGYTRDFPLEQVYRDNRLNMIHEGANGILAITLLARSTQLAGGEGWRLLSTRIRKCVDRATASGVVKGGISGLPLGEMAWQLDKAEARLSRVTGVMTEALGG